jgi:hypothetical protein
VLCVWSENLLSEAVTHPVHPAPRRGRASIEHEPVQETALTADRKRPLRVCAAAPGVVSILDLPLFTARSPGEIRRGR